MEFIEGQADLFEAPEYYFFAHCISADFKLGAGIAREFCRRFDTRSELFANYSKPEAPACLLTTRTLNLVTKKNYWHKPTLKSMEQALMSMRQVCKDNDIRYVAMPRIGCGLDRLSWPDVKELALRIFSDTDIRIVACYL